MFKLFVPLFIIWIFTFKETFYPIAAFIDKHKKLMEERKRKAREEDGEDETNYDSENDPKNRIEIK